MVTNTVSTVAPSAKLKQLQNEGYCILENVADEALLERTRACVEHAIGTLDADLLARNPSPGTLIDSGPLPELAGIVGNPTALKALDEMGLSRAASSGKRSSSANRQTVRVYTGTKIVSCGKTRDRTAIIRR